MNDNIVTLELNIDYDSAFKLLKYKIINKDHPDYLKIIHIVSNNIDLSFNLLKSKTITQTNPFFEILINSIIVDSHYSYYLIYKKIITTHSSCFNKVIKSIVDNGDSDYSFLLLEQDNIITQDSPFFYDAVTNAIKKYQFAYTLLTEKIIPKNHPLFNLTVKSAIQNNECDCWLVEYNIISQQELNSIKETL